MTDIARKRQFAEIGKSTTEEKKPKGNKKTKLPTQAQPAAAEEEKLIEEPAQAEQEQSPYAFDGTLSLLAVAI